MKAAGPAAADPGRLLARVQAGPSGGRALVAASWALFSASTAIQFPFSSGSDTPASISLATILPWMVAGVAGEKRT